MRLLLLLLTPFRFLPTSVRGWFLTEVWVKASLLKSPGHFSVFWPITIMLSFGRFPFVPLFSSPPVFVPIIWWLCQGPQFEYYNRHLHVPQFFQLPSKVQVLIPIFTFFQFHSVVCQDSKIHNFASSLFLIIIRPGRLAEIWLAVCISKYQRSLRVSFSRTDSGLCIYHLFV